MEPIELAGQTLQTKTCYYKNSAYILHVAKHFITKDEWSSFRYELKFKMKLGEGLISREDFETKVELYSLSVVF